MSCYFGSKIINLYLTQASSSSSPTTPSFPFTAPLNHLFCHREGYQPLVLCLLTFSLSLSCACSSLVSLIFFQNTNKRYLCDFLIINLIRNTDSWQSQQSCFYTTRFGCKGMNMQVPSLLIHTDPLPSLKSVNFHKPEKKVNARHKINKNIGNTCINIKLIKHTMRILKLFIF